MQSEILHLWCSFWSLLSLCWRWVLAVHVCALVWTRLFISISCYRERFYYCPRPGRPTTHFRWGLQRPLSRREHISVGKIKRIRMKVGENSFQIDLSPMHLTCFSILINANDFQFQRGRIFIAGSPSTGYNS